MRRADLPADVLERVAIVYVRQSTQAQMHQNLESQRRQYELVTEARRYGFHNVEVIDEDLGTSASGSVERPGFQRLVGRVCSGEVGAVFALEASRFARNGREWHHLVELCGLVGARVIDAEGVYDPSRPNDRLLLGLKGTMSEFELNVMHRRLHDAAQAKAARGELRFQAPIGYVWSTEARRFEMDPDRRVQEAIRTVFALFDELGSARKVMLAMHRQGLSYPTPSDGRASPVYVWRSPSCRAIVCALRNPFYAGAYGYGKSKSRVEIVDGRPQRTYGHGRPMAEWTVLLKDHHAAYLTWEAFERNQARLSSNAYAKPAGVPKSGRGGRALLTSLLRCARCGRGLRVAYNGNGKTARYGCRGDASSLPVYGCFSVRTAWPDAAIGRELLRVLQPQAVEAALKAVELAHERTEAARLALARELEAARYEVRLAARRYEAVDPDKRLVAAELEARWEAALAAAEDVERRLLTQQQAPTVEPDPQTLLALADDLETVWNDPDTDMALEQRLVRVLIREIVIDVDAASKEIVLVIHWAGGRHSELRIHKPSAGENGRRAPDSAVDLIRSLASRSPDHEIAATLNRMGIHTGHGNTWTDDRVAAVRRAHDIPTYNDIPDERPWLTLIEAAHKLGVGPGVVRRLVQERILPARQVIKWAPWQILPADLEAPLVQQALRQSGHGPCAETSKRQERLFSDLSRKDAQ